MVKLNRNAACPCGSGKKYKRCCLPRDQETAAQRRDQMARVESASPPPFVVVDDDNPDQLSNGILDLIEQDRLDEAEKACRQLKREFPELIDWIERTGAVHEARGETEKAVEYYRQCLQFIDDNPGNFEEASKDWYRRSIERLESTHKSDKTSDPGA